MMRGTRLRAALCMAATALLTLSGTRAVSDDLLMIACDDMTPRHPGYKPENASPSAYNPYRLLVDTPVVPGGLVNVTLVPAKNGVPHYKGFMIQARDADDRVIGTFLPACGGLSEAKPYHMLTCSNGVQSYNTVVQSSNKDKVHETFTWVAPVSLDRPFIFKYTVVLDFEHFWVNEETPEVPVVPLSKEEYATKSSINHDFYIYQLFLKNCYS